MEELIQWLDANHIEYNIKKDVVFVKGWGKALFQDMTNREHIFKKDDDGHTVFNCIENIEFLLADEIYYVIFQFGDRFFYQDIRDSKPNFQILKYIGKIKPGVIDCEYYPLGIHTGYELLNGSGSLENWCQKAAFLGYEGLGISDRCTMAATLDLQREATKIGLKYTFGYQLTVATGNSHFDAKIYSNTQRGFENMLRIQKAVCVDREDGTIDYIDLLNHAEGNCLVFDKMSSDWLVSNESKIPEIMDAFDDFVYFQVDTTEYRANMIDEPLLFSLKKYFDHFYIGQTGEVIRYKHNLRPILIQDVYYIDADDYMNKIILNKVDKGAAHNQSYKQYMKTLDELYDEFRNIFSEKYSDDVFYDMCESTAEIVENSEAAYDLTENYMPEYIMTNDERVRFKNNHDMFLSLLEEGFERLVPKGQEEVYRQRLEYEVYILEQTENIDYCNVQYDSVSWANKNGIMTGVGRGSAGGSLVLYLLGITLIDPIQYGLIFERFLIPERAGLEPSDTTIIAQDITSKEYIELEMEDGKTYKFDKDAEFHVKRGEEIINVYADELLPDDDIIFDNRDLKYTLAEV